MNHSLASPAGAERFRLHENEEGGSEIVFVSHVCLLASMKI